MRALAAVCTLGLAFALACSSPTEPSAVGTWGGREASLVLSRSGGQVGYQCGAGTIDSTWTLSDEGKFTAAGVHFFGGGPEPIQGRPPHPATYVGQVSGTSMVFTVTLTDLAQTLGPFHLTRGGPPVPELCL